MNLDDINAEEKSNSSPDPGVQSFDIPDHVRPEYERTFSTVEGLTESLNSNASESAMGEIDSDEEKREALSNVIDVSAIPNTGSNLPTSSAIPQIANPPGNNGNALAAALDSGAESAVEHAAFFDAIIRVGGSPVRMFFVGTLVGIGGAGFLF